MFTTLEQTPLVIDLVAQARSTGWTVDGTSAIHEACNAGMFRVKDYALKAGTAYKFSFQIESISLGYLQAYMGTTAGVQYTTPGFKQETLIASGTNLLFGMYSNADTKITLLDITPVATTISPKAKNSIVWNEDDNTWPCFMPVNADCGFSLFSNLYTYKNGDLYVQRANSISRNNLYGTQYPTIVKLTAKQSPENVKAFHSIALQSNQLMITTTDGITTSLGHVSDLLQEDFLKDELIDGAIQVDVYDKEGIFSASFLRAKPDLINGDVLKGHYLTVELTTVESGVLKLFTVAIHAEVSRIGVR